MKPLVRKARRHNLMCFIWECDCGHVSERGYRDHLHAIADATRHTYWCDEGTQEAPC